MNKNILLAACTHGDELIGLKAVQKLKRTSFSKDFDFVIANPVALEKNIRFIDADLNRVAPGNINSEKFEERRAAEILDLAKNYDLILDLHGSVSKSCGIFIIITNLTKENLLLASWLDIKNIVIWLGEPGKPTGPWTQYAGQAIEIECGDKNNPAVKNLLEKKLRKFLQKIRKNKLSNNLNENLKNKNVFEVYGKLIDGPDGKLRDFKLTKFNDEEFYPLLSGQYQDVKCYKMRTWGLGTRNWGTRLLGD